MKVLTISGDMASVISGGRSPIPQHNTQHPANSPVCFFPSRMRPPAGKSMEENAVLRVYAERECPSGCAPFTWEYMENGKPEILVLVSPGADAAKAMRFLAQQLEKAGIFDWLMVLSCFCNTNAVTACRANVEKLIDHAMPKIILPCGNAACSLFGIRKAGLFLLHRKVPSAVIPFCDPRDLLKDTGENVANYLCFLQDVNDIRILSFMLQSRRPDSGFFTENGMEFVEIQ